MATIKQALAALNPYPISSDALDVILLDRDLTGSDEYTKTIGLTQGYELAKADTWLLLHDSPSIVEQEVGINNAIRIKENMLERANAIYAKYKDAKFNGKVYGFIGDKYNG